MDSILKTESESKLLAACDRALQNIGFRIVDMDVHVSGRSLVRIFIEPASLPSAQVAKTSTDTAPGAESEKKSTSIDDCVKATQLLGPVIEGESVLPGAYELEVSSPGLDRRLRLKADFERALGEQIKLKLTESLNGQGANLTGTLSRLSAGENPGIMIQIPDQKGRELDVPLAKIKRAHIVWRPKGN